MADTDVFLFNGDPTPTDVRLRNAAATASEGVTVASGVGSLTLAGVVPAVLTPQVVRPAVGLLTLAGLVPSIRVPRVVVPPVGVLTLAGLAPTVVTPRTVRPSVGVLTVTGMAPSVLTPRVVRPSVGVLTVTGFSPTVTVSAATVAQPGTGALALIGVAPLVLTPQTVRPGVGVLALVGFVPTVVVAAGSSSVLAQPGVGALVLTGYEPTVTGDPVSQQGGAFGYIQRIRRSRQTVWLVGETFAPTVVIAPVPRRFVAPPKARPAVAIAGVGALALEGFAPVVAVVAPAPAPEPDATGEPAVIAARGKVATALGIVATQTEQYNAPVPVEAGHVERPPQPATETLTPAPAWLASPIVVDVGYATLLLDGFAPTVAITTRPLAPEPWSPDEDDAAMLWAAYDLLVNA